MQPAVPRPPADARNPDEPGTCTGTGTADTCVLRPVLAATAQAATSSMLPRPYVILPRAIRVCRQGRRHAAQRALPVLFHETWVQPLEPEPGSLPIVLDRSGDSQQWPALQGSVRLYLSRYLHIETNLWLNTAGQYLPGTWRMPAPPFGPPSLIIEEEEVVDMAAAIDGMPGENAPATEATTAVVEMAAAGDTVTAVAADPAGDAVDGVAAVEAPPRLSLPPRRAVTADTAHAQRRSELYRPPHAGCDYQIHPGDGRATGRNGAGTGDDAAG